LSEALLIQVLLPANAAAAQKVWQANGCAHMKQQKPDPILILMIILVAIILAVAVFLTVLYVQGRPPVGTSTVQVEGIEVIVQSNPDDLVVIVGSPGQGGEATAVPPESLPTPTDTPIPPPTETPIPPTPLPQPDQVILVIHVVSSTDTLFSLSNQYNTTIPLMARYGISAADLIPGNSISLAVANPAYCPGRRPYVVAEGDTPLSISQTAGISLDEFRQINNLTENSPLRFTEVVCLP